MKRTWGGPGRHNGRRGTASGQAIRQKVGTLRSVPVVDNRCEKARRHVPQSGTTDLRAIPEAMLARSHPYRLQLPVARTLVRALRLFKPAGDVT